MGALPEVFAAWRSADESLKSSLLIRNCTAPNNLRKIVLGMASKITTTLVAKLMAGNSLCTDISN